MAWANLSRAAWIVGPLLALGACASSPVHFGDAGPQAADRSFAMSDQSAAGTAVRRALVDAGYREQDNGKLRVEVGFALRPRDLAVVAPGEQQSPQVISPATGRSLSLCKRQAYVLTIAFVDRATGKITSRGGSTIARCSGTAADVLPQLARTALASVRS